MLNDKYYETYISTNSHNAWLTTKYILLSLENYGPSRL